MTNKVMDSELLGSLNDIDTGNNEIVSLWLNDMVSTLDIENLLKLKEPERFYEMVRIQAELI